MFHVDAGIGLRILAAIGFGFCILVSATACTEYGIEVSSRATVRHLVPSGYRYASIALSPDRRLLAAERWDHDRAVREVVVLSLGETLAETPKVVGSGARPAWLSNERLLFFRDDAEGNADLWIASAREAGAKPLTRTATAETDVSVAPDGHRLLIERGTGVASGFTEEEIVLVELGENDHLTEVATLAVRDTKRGVPVCPVWSPDGRLIAYWRQGMKRMRSGMFVMNADGTGDHLLRSEAVPRAWTPDGRSIFYQRQSGIDVNGELWTIGVDGTGDHLVLADTYSRLEAISARQWDPRGRRLALATQQLIGGFDANGFRSPTGIVVLDASGAILADLRRSGRRDVMEGGVQWDWRGRLVFATRMETWFGDQQREQTGVFSLDTVTADERLLLPNTERYAEQVAVP